MKKLYQMITAAWNFSKWMYEVEIKDVDDWSVIYKTAAKLAESFKDEKDNKCMRELLCVCMNYYEAEIREKRKKEKMNG